MRTALSLLDVPASGVRLATLDTRAAEPGVSAAAAQLGWSPRPTPPRCWPPSRAPAPSARVAAAVGTPSVAEAAALLGGAGSLLGKLRARRVTVAVAR